ncbi:MAG: class I SAM-dependent methyltransferase [Erythrobacter sp.]|uniref:SAM-dependent methyltransferase n=1 Tax=Erythrobacter sp. TaxID=1042 RepID=UPI001B0D48DC|nr:class I SAM-dependent methyltransferase [Erythrobacter sp.]MBO6529102.1 class I SAM-dependent methyltransferase [Erythrobacter sp.]
MADAIDALEFWDKRFAGDDYVFGTQPNAFLVREAHRLEPGARVLAVADGEGRNSVFLAKHSHKVVATDISERALEKADRLAAKSGVEIQFVQADLATWIWPENAFDAVVAIFIEFAAPEMRERIFEKTTKALKPGGLLLLEGYRPEQLAFGTGGPPSAENMYTEAVLREAFGALKIELLESYDAEISEGKGHAGMSALIDLIARRPN